MLDAIHYNESSSVDNYILVDWKAFPLMHDENCYGENHNITKVTSK